MSPGKMNLNSTSSKTQLRSFGLMMSGMIFLVFGFIFPVIRHGFSEYPSTIPRLVLGFCAFFFLFGLFFPVALQPIYRLWMKLGGVLGWINTRILLSLVYFLLVTPLALVFKALGKDPMNRKLNKKTQSYRKDLKSETTRYDMERPY